MAAAVSVVVVEERMEGKKDGRKDVGEE